MIVRAVFIAFALSIAGCKSGGAPAMDANPGVEACKQGCDSTKGQCVDACKDKTGADLDTCNAACETACNECKGKCDETK
ncbi:MAG: hypothetical protein HYV07_06565 [Deltaproteobacteria bacterium]|nr:hypothetical protein [Deltaproteobacteria bacterium]